MQTTTNLVELPTSNTNAYWYISLRQNADLRNLGLIVIGFLCVLLFISPARAYPITDDWIYFQSVGDLLRLSYAPHDWTQPIALGHLSWGALFSALFGHTFTVLTISNLVMSIACLIIFYVLLRHLNISSGYALLGAAVLGFNPIYVFLTYSFMTDITFLAYMLAACLCYIRGTQGHGEDWLWLGGLSTALAYLTRQYGVLIMVAALAYMLLSRRWSWRRTISIVAIPVAAAVIYAIWERFQPTPLIAIQMDQVRQTELQHIDRFLTDRAFRLTWMLPSLGLSLLPLLWLSRRSFLAIPPLVFLVYYQLQSLHIVGTLWPQNGNIIDVTGYILYSYNAEAIWSQWAWSGLGLAGALVFSLFFAFYVERAWSWVRARPWSKAASEHAQDPALILYALGLMLVGVILVLTPFLFDRYWLALLPILCVPVLRRMSAQNPQPSVSVQIRLASFRWALLAPLALFSLVAQRDYNEHAGARWNAAESLTAQGISPDHIKAGYEWDGLYNFKAGAQRIRETHDLTHIGYPPEAVIDPEYVVSDLLDDDLRKQGYVEAGSVPYKSWLDGGVDRRVLVLHRQ